MATVYIHNILHYNLIISPLLLERGVMSLPILYFKLPT